MKLEVKLSDVSHDTVDVSVKMDKEEFGKTVDGYKYLMEQRILPGDEITCMTLVRKILHEVEKGCAQ